MGLAILFALIEALTLGLSTIWFALGSLLALLCAVLNLHPWVQFIVFLISSVALLWFTRPIAKKYLKIGTQKTNAESLVGKEALVISRIEKFANGQVKVNGQQWTARSLSHAVIEEGTVVLVVGIEGVKLIVEMSAQTESEKNSKKMDISEPIMETATEEDPSPIFDVMDEAAVEPIQEAQEI